MKKAILVLIIFFLAVSSTALNEDLIYSVRDIDTTISISSSLEVSKTSPHYTISYVTANLSFMPMTRENQQITEINYEPEPYMADNGLVYKWEGIDVGKYDFRLNAELTNNVNIKRIKQKVNFPIQNLDPEYEKYTLATENIDANDEEIIKKASEIVAGQDDLYAAVFELVKWIKKTVEYDLNTLTAEVSQKASWVLKNKYGVCDEITSLFVAMSRSLGIPVKYISGMAYTNWEGINDWGPHAWAEVYFPGQGWVAYDITYGEFGYVDATHIVLKESLDSDESSTHYEWRGKNIDVDANELAIKVRLVDKRGSYGNDVRLEINPLNEEIGFGSYNLIELEIENLRDYYIAEEINLAKVSEIEVIGEEKRQVLLEPKETKKVHWIVKVGDGLDERFIYTIPIKAYTVRNDSAQITFKADSKNKIYSEEEIRTVLNQRGEEEKKSYSRKVNLNCSSPENYVYSDEKLKVSCLIRNDGNVLLENLEVCLGIECEIVGLGISQEKEVKFSADPGESGKQEIMITANNDEISKADYVKYDSLDKPKIEVSGLEYPIEIKYGEEFSIKFLIDKKSFSNPKNTVITLYQNNVPQKWEVEQLNKSEEFVINMNSNMLGGGENEFRVEIDYEDNKGQKYGVEKSFVVNIETDRFIDKIKLFFNDIEYFFAGLFSKLFS